MKKYIMKFWSVCLICAILFIPVSSVNAANITQIPEDAYEFNENFYKIYNECLTWEEAKLYCENLGGHLATITSIQEQDFICSINFCSGLLWIGAFRDEAFNWQWVTGEEWDYTNWAEGEPNNSSNVISDENCAVIWPDTWNDLNNSNLFEQTGFICEWECKYRTVEIRNPSSSTVLCGDSLILHADYNKDLPVDWRAEWAASNDNFEYYSSDDGTDCLITSSKSGETIFTVSIYDADGNEVSSDELTMISQAGLFDKIISFFKRMFGLTRVYLQKN